VIIKILAEDFKLVMKRKYKEVEDSQGVEQTNTITRFFTASLSRELIEKWSLRLDLSSLK
jgi:hypothetical protein